MKLETERLSLKPKVENNFELAFDTRFEIGNSGLIFVKYPVDKTTLFMHFQPDYYSGIGRIDQKCALKYSSVFCAAFYEFLMLWVDGDTFPFKPRPRYIEGTTNSRMHRFRQSLFNEFQTTYKSLGDMGDMRDYRIDIEKVISQPKLLERLRAISERCLRANYMMEV